MGEPRLRQRCRVYRNDMTLLLRPLSERAGQAFRPAPASCREQVCDFHGTPLCSGAAPSQGSSTRQVRLASIPLFD